MSYIITYRYTDKSVLEVKKIQNDSEINEFFEKGLLAYEHSFDTRKEAFYLMMYFSALHNIKYWREDNIDEGQWEIHHSFIR